MLQAQEDETLIARSPYLDENGSTASIVVSTAQSAHTWSQFISSSALDANNWTLLGHETANDGFGFAVLQAAEEQILYQEFRVLGEVGELVDYAVATVELGLLPLIHRQLQSISNSLEIRRDDHDIDD